MTIKGNAYLDVVDLYRLTMTSCKCKYKLRRFYSKGAFLVLAWCFLLSVSANSYISTINIATYKCPDLKSNWYLIPLFLVVSLSALISGLLADAKFGKYKVIRAGFLLLFLSSLILSVSNVINAALPAIEDCHALWITSTVIINIVAIVGAVAIAINILQLGLDQMPDASTPSITSFIAWFMFSLAFGYWICGIFESVDCWYQLLTQSDTMIVWSFISVLCAGIVLITDYLFAKKWLIIEPKSLQSLKTIYRVLKFAAKHKAPLNRSAFTYWEEDIPSRLDLGKSKYGGPFTTEEVEDVKTILQLLVLSLSFASIAFSTQLYIIRKRVSYTFQNGCSNHVLKIFTYDEPWCFLVANIVHEFIIYPLVRDRLPSILKKIGIASYLSILLSIFSLMVEIITHYFDVDQDASDWVACVVYSVMNSYILLVLSTSAIEYVCAQSPFNVREISIAYMFITIGVSTMLGLGSREIHVWQHTPYLAQSVKSVLCLVSFMVYCIIAHWYKRRVRDDIYSTHQVVEEVYDRYLSHSAYPSNKPLD